MNMTDTVLNYLDPVTATATGFKDLWTVGHVLYKNEKRTLLENLNLTQTALSAIGNIATSCGLFGSVYLTGKTISSSLRNLFMVARVASAWSQVFPEGLNLLTKLEEKNVNFLDLLSFLSTIFYQGSTSLLDANRLYGNFIQNCAKKIPIVLPYSLKTYLQTKGINAEDIAEGLMEGFAYLRKGSYACNSAPKWINSFYRFGYTVYRQIRGISSNQQPIESTTSTSTQEHEREFLVQFATRVHLQACSIDQLVIAGLKQKKLEKFICPITKCAISWPLKHIASGCLFEKERIENALAHHPHFAFHIGGITYDITRESLIESQEDREQICRVKAEIFETIKRLFTSHLQTTTSRGFQNLKSYVWNQVQIETDTLLAQMLSQAYWLIDPRQWVIEIGKKFLSAVVNEQKESFEHAQNNGVLREKLVYLRDTTIPGYLSFFNPLTNFSPLSLVKKTMVSMPARITHVIEVVDMELVPIT
jgi:hypothetical protein